MLKRLLIFLLVLGFNYQIYAQNEIENQAKVLTQYLQEWHNKNTGLWETTSWWNAANVLTTLIKYTDLTKDESYKDLIAFTFEKTKKFVVEASDERDAWICENYINDYYDDEGWWALAWLDAWEFTGEQRYLDMALVIFEDITTGWSEDGGIYWKKGVDLQASISSGLTFTLASRLHLAGVKIVNGKSALQWATSIWEWVLDSQLLDKNGNIQDGLRSKDGKKSISPNIWTYNQGAFLSGLVNLHKITKEASYLSYAHKIAQATLKQMTNDNGILVEKICEPDNCNGDSKQFKGVFMRHLATLNTYDSKNEYEQFFLKSTSSIWDHSMQKGAVPPGVIWDGVSQADAATVSSALDAFNATLSLSVE